MAQAVCLAVLGSWLIAHLTPRAHHDTGGGHLLAIEEQGGKDLVGSTIPEVVSISDLPR